MLSAVQPPRCPACRLSCSPTEIETRLCVRCQNIIPFRSTSSFYTTCQLDSVLYVPCFDCRKNFFARPGVTRCFDCRSMIADLEGRRSCCLLLISVLYTPTLSILLLTHFNNPIPHRRSVKGSAHRQFVLPRLVKNPPTKNPASSNKRLSSSPMNMMLVQRPHENHTVGEVAESKDPQSWQSAGAESPFGK